MSTPSLLSSIQTYKVDQSAAARLQSDRFENSAINPCQTWTGYDSAGRPVAQDTFYTMQEGCDSADARIDVENALRPNYSEYIYLSADAIANGGNVPNQGRRENYGPAGSYSRLGALSGGRPSEGRINARNQYISEDSARWSSGYAVRGAIRNNVLDAPSGPTSFEPFAPPSGRVTSAAISGVRGNGVQGGRRQGHPGRLDPNNSMAARMAKPVNLAPEAARANANALRAVGARGNVAARGRQIARGRVPARSGRRENFTLPANYDASVVAQEEGWRRPARPSPVAVFMHGEKAWNGDYHHRKHTQ